MPDARGREPVDLRLGFCSHAAAEYACKRWHYSECLPPAILKLVKIGVWERDRFVGAVVFGRSTSPWIGHAYQLDHTEICELRRVALDQHETEVSRIVSISLRMLRRASPGLRLVVSFADPAHDHHGGIYQAGNWIYTGTSQPVTEYLIGGVWRHVRGSYHDPRRLRARTRTRPPKHRYLYPLDAATRALVEPLRKPYPKPVAA